MIHVVSPKKIPMLKMKQTDTNPQPFFFSIRCRPFIAAVRCGLFEILQNARQRPKAFASDDLGNDLPRGGLVMAGYGKFEVGISFDHLDPRYRRPSEGVEEHTVIIVRFSEPEQIRASRRQWRDIFRNRFLSILRVCPSEQPDIGIDPTPFFKTAGKDDRQLFPFFVKIESLYIVLPEIMEPASEGNQETVPAAVHPYFPVPPCNACIDDLIQKHKAEHDTGRDQKGEHESSSRIVRLLQLTEAGLSDSDIQKYCQTWRQRIQQKFNRSVSQFNYKAFNLHSNPPSYPHILCAALQFETVFIRKRKTVGLEPGSVCLENRLLPPGDIQKKQTCPIIPAPSGKTVFSYKTFIDLCVLSS